jgi:hypothetical protein
VVLISHIEKGECVPLSSLSLSSIPRALEKSVSYDVTSQDTPSTARRRELPSENMLDQTKYEWTNLWYSTACGKGQLHVHFLYRKFVDASSNASRSSVLLRQQLSAEGKLLGRYGFPIPSPLLNDERYSKWQSAYMDDETKVSQKWFSVMRSGSGSDGFASVINKQLVRRGVPPSLRPRVWLSCASSRKNADGRGYYHLQLIKYEMEGKSNVSTVQIERDLLRTFPDHPLYTTQEGISSLRRVLTAFSVHNKEIGYCQSMNFICGLLLLFLDEEDAFYVLSHIVETLVPMNYTADLLGVQVDTQVVMALANEKLPKIMSHIASFEFPMEDSITKWMLQLFVNILPIECVLRIFDLFLTEGSKVLIRMALAVLKVNESGLLACKSFEDLWVFVEKCPTFAFDPNALVHVAMNSLGNFRSVSELRAKYTRKVKQKALVRAIQYSRVNDLFTEEAHRGCHGRE